MSCTAFQTTTLQKRPKGGLYREKKTCGIFLEKEETFFWINLGEVLLQGTQFKTTDMMVDTMGQ